MGMGGMVGGITQGVFATIAGAFAARSSTRSRREMQEIMGRDPAYEKMGYKNDMLGLAANRLNSRMTGAAQQERNIYSNAGNTISATNRYASDPSQAAAFALAAQGQADKSFGDMALAEAGDYENKYAALDTQKDRVANADREENRYGHEDKVRRFQDEMNFAMTKYKMRMAGAQGISNYGNQMASSMNSVFGSGGANMGVNGVSSDKRLKHSYYTVGKSPSGLNIYEFCYMGSDDRYQGVMAQEVPHAAVIMPNGYLGVDYNKIDVEFKKLS